MNYGVTPQGFARKSLAEILAEIEAQMVTEFGPGVIQSAQSPLGQINGLMADLIAQIWEFAEDVYQSYDVDQAEGVRLEMLAKIRLLMRATGESDTDFRRAITNTGRARIDLQDIARAVRGLPGVTYTQVFVNDSTVPDENNLPPGTICVAVLGGDDMVIAETMREYIVPGISTYGNVSVSTNRDGYCRSMLILRPVLVPVKLTINVRLKRDLQGCPAPSPTAVWDAFIANTALGGAHMLINGDDLDHFRIRSTIESRYSNVEVVSFTGERDNQATQGVNLPVAIGFVELATLSPADVTVNAL